MLGAAPLVSFMKPMLMGLLLQRILCQLVQKSDRFGWRSQLVAPKKNFAWLSFGQGVAEPHLVFDRVAHELDDATGHNRLPSSGKLVAQPDVLLLDEPTNHLDHSGRVNTNISGALSRAA